MLHPRRTVPLLASLTLALALAGCGAPAATTTAPTAIAVATTTPVQPTDAPTTAPTAAPTAQATAAPTTAPTTMPTAEPMATAEATGALSSTNQLGTKTQALVTAALAYERKQANLTADDLVRVEVEGVDGDYARVVLVPAMSLQIDPATAFFKRSGDTWEGISLGTAFAPDDLKQLKIPKRLQTLSTDAMYDPKNDTVPAGDYLLGVVSDSVLQAAAKEGRSALGLPNNAVVSGDIIGIDGDYARVQITPQSTDVDLTTVFLKRSGSTWNKVLSGTAFPADDLQKLGIPASLERDEVSG